MKSPTHVFTVIHGQALAPLRIHRKDSGKHAKNLREEWECRGHYREEQQSLINRNFPHTFVHHFFSPWNTLYKCGKQRSRLVVPPYIKKKYVLFFKETLYNLSIISLFPPAPPGSGPR